jgi:hypothetical protein
MVLDAAGIFPGMGDDIQNGVAVFLVRDHVLQDPSGVMCDGVGPGFVQVSEDPEDRFPGKILQVILGRSIIYPQHAEDSVCPLHIAAHPI